ncbi:MAG: hypothetical protein R3230_01555 [Nitrosopumilaceae archaeon]|nr:hypothetical protein [Nitrosopumilaceae archaeon]
MNKETLQEHINLTKSAIQEAEENLNTPNLPERVYVATEKALDILYKRLMELQSKYSK